MVETKYKIWSNDHIPPHVTVGNKSEGWEARVQFSFVSNVSGFINIVQRHHDPNATAQKTVLVEITRGIVEWRCKWWTTKETMNFLHKYVRLEAKPVPDFPDNHHYRILSGSKIGTDIQCTKERYEPDYVDRAGNQGCVWLTLNGTEHRLTCGLHTEENNTNIWRAR